MQANYHKVVEMTDQEKFNMYMKLSKKEIVRMHIELEKSLMNTPVITIGSIPYNPASTSITTKQYPYTLT